MNDDYQVIQSVVNGSVESFRVLVKRYEGPLFRMIQNLVPDQHECEDIAQDTFLTAFEKLSSFDPRRAVFSTWLLTIARNKCLNRLKKRKPIVLETLPEEGIREASAAPFSDNEALEYMDSVLAALPCEQKTAFVLFELHGLSYEQISQIEQAKIGTVKSRIHRAKEKLRLMFTRLSEPW